VLDWYLSASGSRSWRGHHLSLWGRCRSTFVTWKMSFEMKIILNICVWWPETFFTWWWRQLIAVVFVTLDKKLFWTTRYGWIKTVWKNLTSLEWVCPSGGWGPGSHLFLAILGDWLTPDAQTLGLKWDKRQKNHHKLVLSCIRHFIFKLWI